MSLLKEAIPPAGNNFKTHKLLNKKEAVKPYGGEGSKKVQVERMFDNIAPRYDLLNRVLSLGIDRGWRRKAIRILRASGPKLVLDVATGTGDLAIEIAKKSPEASVVGLDISQEMLKAGRVKIAHRKLDDRIEMVKGDSEDIRYPDNTFDGITVAFGVRNFEHLDRGLREMLRVLKPGGKLIVLEFSQPYGFPFRQLFQWYFKNILPRIGRVASTDPAAYGYLYESVQAFPEGEEFVHILQANGFKNSQCKPLTLGVCSLYVAEKER